MKTILISFFLCCFLYPALVVGQENTLEESENDTIVLSPNKVDKLYREDQFYFGFSFNLLSNRPPGVSQSGFSGGLHLGFIRDMPVNKQRNIAFGAGLGLSANSYGLNLLIAEENQNTIFHVLGKDIGYETNRYSTYLVEAPLQFRWRTSTPESHKFWRIYAGLRFGYMFHFKSNFKQANKQIVQRNIDELNRFRTGLTFSFGYNTFNFHVYYSLNPLFDANTLENAKPVGLNTIKLGLMFYIL